MTLRDSAESHHRSGTRALVGLVLLFVGLAMLVASLLRPHWLQRHGLPAYEWWFLVALGLVALAGIILWRTSVEDVPFHRRHIRSSDARPGTGASPSELSDRTADHLFLTDEEVARVNLHATDTILATWTVHGRKWIPQVRWHLAIGILLVAIPVILWIIALIATKNGAAYFPRLVWLALVGIGLIRRAYLGTATTFLSPRSFDPGSKIAETGGRLYWEPYAGPGQWHVHSDGVLFRAEVRHRGAWRLLGLLDYPHEFIARLPYERIRSYRTKAKAAATVILFDYGHVEGQLYPLEFTIERDGEAAFQSFERALNQYRQRQQA